MRVPNYLVISSSSRYYFRIIVPRELRKELGQREFRRALRTTDYATALLRSLLLAKRYRAFFEELQMKKNPLFQDLIITTTTACDGSVTENVTFDDPDIAADVERFKAHQQQKGAGMQVGKLLAEAKDAFIAEQKAKGAWKSGTAQEYETLYERLVSIVGNKPLKSVDRADALRLLQTVQKMPKKNGAPLSVNVINKRVGMMSSLLKYCIRNQWTNYNPFEGLQIEETTKSSDLRDPYTHTELAALLDPQYFTQDAAQPARFWIPLIMLFTGMRPSEIATLEEGDFIEINGQPCINIPTGKTKNSARTIPVVEELTFRGLLDYMENVRRSKKKDRRLFPELSKTRLKPAGAVSSWWNVTHHKHCGVENQTVITQGRSTRLRKVSLYSIRHMVSNELQNAHVSDSERSEILGHEKGDNETTKTYTFEDINRMYRNLRKLSYTATAQVSAWSPTK